MRTKRTTTLDKLKNQLQSHFNCATLFTGPAPAPVPSKETRRGPQGEVLRHLLRPGHGERQPRARHLQGQGDGAVMDRRDEEDHKQRQDEQRLPESQLEETVNILSQFCSINF